MKKTVYSLVLSSDVVSQIDQLAYGKRTSRSNLINQILAEYISYVTPEKRMEEILSCVQQVFGEMNHFQMLLHPSDSMLSIKSALTYKYNPSVRYSVELYPRGEELGELRVSLRSQSAPLLHGLKQFFQIWVRIEEAYGIRARYTLESGRFTRKLLLPRQYEGDHARQGTMIADYIRAMDGGMKGYFTHLGDRAAGVREIEARYLAYLKEYKESL